MTKEEFSGYMYGLGMIIAMGMGIVYFTETGPDTIFAFILGTFFAMVCSLGSWLSVGILLMVALMGIGYG